MCIAPSLLSSMAIMAMFHPFHQGLVITRSGSSVKSRMIFHSQAKTMLSQLEIDIALASDPLKSVVAPDFYHFCKEIEALFKFDVPKKPAMILSTANTAALKRIVDYGACWHQQSATEVKKLSSYMMIIPLFAYLFEQKLKQDKNEISGNFAQTSQQANYFYIGNKRFQSLFQPEIVLALSHARSLVSLYWDVEPVDASTVNELAFNIA